MTWGIVTNKNHVPPSRLDFVRIAVRAHQPRSMEDIIALMKHAPDLRPPCAPPDVPKLVAVGSHDLWPIALHARPPSASARELVVYDTGHSPCETTPHQLARDMLALFATAEVR